MASGWISPEHQHPHVPATTASRSRRRDRGSGHVVLQVDSTGVYVVPVTLRRRVQAVLLADRLDRMLAQGLPPESDVLLALHAEHLARPGTRSELASSVGRLLRAAAEPEGGFMMSSSMAVLSRVRDTRVEFQALVDQLLAPVPVSAQGVALVRLLLRDGSGPLFRYEARDDLAAQVRRAVEALDPGRDWPA